MTDWQPVTGTDGGVLGWMGAPDPGEPDVDYFEADRLPKVRRRAAAIDEAAALLMDDAFDPGETWDAAEASGLPPGAIDSAGNVALALREVERDVT